MTATSPTNDLRYEAEVNWPAIRRLTLITLGIAAFFVARGMYQSHLAHQAEALETAMLQVQLGMSITEAKALMGRPPNQVGTFEGVFAHGGATIFHVSNPRATQYGQPRTYTSHLWRTAPVSVSIYTDNRGIVIQRRSDRDRRLPTKGERLVRWIIDHWQR